MDSSVEEVPVVPRRRRTAADQQAPAPAPTAEEIAVRAYELFLERGGEHGKDVDDWLRAERELGRQTIEAARLTRELHEKPRS